MNFEIKDQFSLSFAHRYVLVVVCGDVDLVIR
jgi:hypothetical protein